jgi:hypothetical protein
MDADGSLTTRHLWTVKSCGPDASTLASSFADQFVERRRQESPIAEESTK